MAQTNDDDGAVSLGKKHQEYNKTFRDAIANKMKLEEKTFTAGERDTDNLLKIDIACHNKDIDYILSVLKSPDILYVSRAINQCAWLVDDQYEHIINPAYLNDELFPEMTAKACIKLLKHVRHYLKTERRIEDFYNNETSPEKAQKWLSRCSVPFIIKNIDKHDMYEISDLEYKRLCEKSFTIFELCMKSDFGSISKLRAASFLLNTHVEQYLDVFETKYRYTFSPKHTEIIMKQTPDRIKNKFWMYINYIHVPTFVKYIKKEEIKDFLYILANKHEEDINHNFERIFHFNVVKHFVKRMPIEEQFEFVKKVFLDKNFTQIKDESLERGTEMFAIKRICTAVCTSTPSYYWYEFASFNTAFTDVEKLIQAETDIYEKYSMLNVLLKCAVDNTQNLLSLLMYFFKNHQNDDVYQKRTFVNNLISQTEIYKNDDKTWNAFIEIFRSLNVFNEKNSQEYLEIIILHDILRGNEINYENIEKNFKFNTFKRFRSKLKRDDQNKLFEYLSNYVINKIEVCNIQTEDKYLESISWHLKLLDLLKDWQKHIKDYPLILNKIQNLIRIKTENKWKTDLSTIYNKEKSWKRYMFEESLVLNPSHEVCVNALKHDPALLKRYNNAVETLCCDDTISMNQMLRKIRIYWPGSLSNSFTRSYCDRLNKIGGHKALTRGLFTLLPHEPLLNIIKKYAPAEATIDWSNVDERTLSLQRCIAKNMHIARPQPLADTILLYAKGDFLQYALPSLIAIYYNMSRVESQQHIPKLLNAPASLQKHGLHFAFIKLTHNELKNLLADVWKTTKNTTIRAVTFALLFDLMCKEKEDGRALELWEILEVFMDNLSFEEDKKLYEKLPKVNDVPLIIRPKFLVKSYKFLKKLLPNLKNDREEFEYAIDNLAVYTRELMESICPDFVVEIITEFLTAKFYNGEITHQSDGMLKVVTSYILCSKNEDIQTKRYDQILEPLVKRCIAQWNDTHNERYFIRDNFQYLSRCFYMDLRDYVINNKMIVPTKLFNDIKKELDNNLEIPQNYLILTSWKLIVKLTEFIAENDKRDDWNEVCSGIVHSFASFCLNVLKEDVNIYFSCIYILYSTVLTMTITNILPEIVKLQIFEHFLSDRDFIQGYLVTAKLMPTRHFSFMNPEVLMIMEKDRTIKKTIRDHPSLEVKMYYYSVFKDDNEYSEFNRSLIP